MVKEKKEAKQKHKPTNAKKFKKSKVSMKGKSAQAPSGAQDLSASYDEIPYDSYSYADCQPSNLYILGKIFGLPAQNFRQCRVLELGGASGGNLIASAAMFPDSEFVCVDYSKVQVQAGEAQTKDLGLKNLTFKCMSITDITPEFGKFDYIIAHGLFSWIPEELQKEVLRVCSENLNDNGLAYVSYNTFPGWRSVQAMREMMQFHIKPIPDAKTQIKQARALLKLIKEEAPASDSAYIKAVAAESDMLDKMGDFYLFHDHLEEHNNPLYFKDFAALADQSGLQYVTDVHISASHLNNFKPKIQAVLSGLPNLIILEQYVDFLVNRRFRQSVLCKKGAPVSRQMTQNLVDDFYLNCQLEEIKKPDLPMDTRVYKSPRIDFTVKGYPGIIFFQILNESKGKPLSIQEIVTLLCKRLPELSAEDALKVVHNYALSVYLQGGIHLHAYNDTYVSTVSQKPCVSALVRYQASKHLWVTSACHKTIKLKDFEPAFMSYMDGTRTKAEILKALHLDIEKGVLPMRKEGQPLLEFDDWKDQVATILDTCLAFYAENAILES